MTKTIVRVTEDTVDTEAIKFEERIEWYTNRGSTRKLAIHGFCFECAGSTKDSKECHVKTCTLWPFRLGADAGVVNKRAAAKVIRDRKSKATKMNRGKKKVPPES